jgi:hypothetical protein
MRLKSFKLKGNGLNGIEAKITEFINKRGITVIDDVLRKRNVAISYDLVLKINSMRDHLLLLSGVVSDKGAIDEYYEKTVTVNGVDIKETGIVLKGQIAGEYGVISLTSPHVGEEDEYEGYSDMLRIIEEIVERVKTYFDDYKVDISMVKDLLVRENEGNMEEVSRINSMNEDELISTYQEKLEAKGFLIVDPKDMGYEDKDEKNEDEKTEDVKDDDKEAELKYEEVNEEENEVEEEGFKDDAVEELSHDLK